MVADRVVNAVQLRKIVEDRRGDVIDRAALEPPNGRVELEIDDVNLLTAEERRVVDSLFCAGGLRR